MGGHPNPVTYERLTAMQFDEDGSGGAILRVVRSQYSGALWSVCFGPSRLGRNVFHCRVPVFGPLCRELDYPSAYSAAMFSPEHLAFAFADGGWFAREQCYSFGLPLGRAGLNGSWVVGFAAMRHLCDLIGLVPPRRLKGEIAVPDPDLLRTEVDRQMRVERELLERRAWELNTEDTQFGFIPDDVFEFLTGTRERSDIDESDVALALDAAAWEFLRRVVPTGTLPESEERE